MTCATCGALSGSLDTMCGSCGAGQRTAVLLPPIPVTPAELEPEAPAPALAPASRERTPRVAKILLIVAVAVALLASASRMQVAGRLADRTNELGVANAQLTAANDRLGVLGQRVQELEVALAGLHTDLDDANAQLRNAQESLSACQDFIRMAAQLANGGGVPNGAKAQLASDLISCFEGKVPPGLFG